jgi:hypothetical protein
VASLLDMPVALQGQSPGPFTDPDFGNGIGGGQGVGNATIRGVLSGTVRNPLPVPLVNDLVAQLQALVGGLNNFSVDGTGAKTTTDAVIEGLLASSSPAQQAYGTLLNSLNGTQATALLNQLTGLTVSLQPVTNLIALSATYMAFPGLAIDTAGAVPGAYEGTLTVTFTQL